jgi:Alpha-glutamyl/putrescinyl thymine pyrophosphorylase clade 2
MHHRHFLLCGISAPALDPGKHFNSISIVRHGRNTRRTPSPYLLRLCPVQIGAAPSPDAKYRKLVFPKFLKSVGESIKPYGTLGKLIASCFQGDDKKANYLELQRLCMDKWFHWGRMGHWCFAEALFRIADAPVEPPTMEFGRDGKSHTAGWAFCIGRDDLTGRSLTQSEVSMLEKSATEYIGRFHSAHPDLDLASFFTLETACCNYKRGYKGTRYQLSYIDEQHTEMMQMIEGWPEYNWLWQKFLEARQAVFPHSLLYENHRADPANDSPTAYLRSLTRAISDFGRIPRVEDYFNNKLQRWSEPY